MRRARHDETEKRELSFQAKYITENTRKPASPVYHYTVQLSALHCVRGVATVKGKLNDEGRGRRTAFFLLICERSGHRRTEETERRERKEKERSREKEVHEHGECKDASVY